MLDFMACVHRVNFQNELEFDGLTVLYSKKGQMIKKNNKSIYKELMISYSNTFAIKI